MIATIIAANFVCTAIGFVKLLNNACLLKITISSYEVLCVEAGFCQIQSHIVLRHLDASLQVL